MLRSIYIVRVPMPGQPDGYYDLVRCLTPESAGAMVRTLLECADPRITGIIVRIDHELQESGRVQ